MSELIKEKNTTGNRYLVGLSESGHIGLGGLKAVKKAQIQHEAGSRAAKKQRLRSDPSADAECDFVTSIFRCLSSGTAAPVGTCATERID